MLGGGQAGWMLGLAGLPLGVHCRFLDPSSSPTAAMVGPVVTGSLDDLHAAALAADGADVVTYEWEGVPAATARHLERSRRGAATGTLLEVSQDRCAEKDTCAGLRIPTTVYPELVEHRAELDHAFAEIGAPGSVKTRRGGYDGKGQAVVRASDDVESAWSQLGGVPLILEALVPFTRELSIIACATLERETRCWPVVENVHRDGILRLTGAPAPRAHDALQRSAEACIVPLLDALDYVGVAVSSWFDVDGGLLVNEIACLGCTTAATGRSRAQKRASSRTTCGPCSVCHLARRLRRWALRDGELHRRHGRPPPRHPRGPRCSTSTRLRQDTPARKESSGTSRSSPPTHICSNNASKRVMASVT